MYFEIASRGKQMVSKFVFLGDPILAPQFQWSLFQNGHRNGPHRFQKWAAWRAHFWCHILWTIWLDYDIDYDQRGANEKKEMRPQKIETVHNKWGYAASSAVEKIKCCPCWTGFHCAWLCVWSQVAENIFRRPPFRQFALFTSIYTVWKGDACANVSMISKMSKKGVFRILQQGQNATNKRSETDIPVKLGWTFSAFSNLNRYFVCLPIWKFDTLWKHPLGKGEERHAIHHRIV